MASLPFLQGEMPLPSNGRICGGGKRGRGKAGKICGRNRRGKAQRCHVIPKVNGQSRDKQYAKQTPCVNSAEAAAHAGQEKDDRLHLILFPNPSGNNAKFSPKQAHQKPCGLNPQGSFYRERRTQTFQISFAYCAIVRSEENMPALAMFIRHLRAKDNSSR